MARGLDAVSQKWGRQLRNHSTITTKRFLKKHQVKVVMGEHLDESIEWIDMAQELGIRFFGHAHAHDVSLRLRDPQWRTRYLQYNNAAGIITVSRYSRDKLIELGLQPSKIHVVPYGVDVPDEPTSRPERTTVRCLAVGRMVGKKGPIFALDAFRRALDRYADLRLDFIGKGALLPAAEQFVRTFGLEEFVTFHGAQPNAVVQQMMRDADIFLQHSTTDQTNGNEDGLPVPILEAMSWAIPVVSTRHAGIPEAVEEGITGYLVDEGDSAGMAELIVRLAREHGLRHSLGHAGWCRAKEHFSWRKEQMQLREILGLAASS
jgi:glycosyltransferase involved in cell wall biosynthesis